MNMTQVVSDNVAAAGYDFTTHTLYITFKNGSTYEYYNVPVHLYEALLLPHPWRVVGRQIRTYLYHRVA
ncbi:MAG: KTSC domain-containing protein [Nocardioides sp.]|uniref:KTSC domain-containing protein n=1 Tax=Nocardioides sp. TaxID=35761 RepID=UPI002390B5AE|nr:KTSC domain-containing protein [Nocardioides sp.]MDE0778928.1 KTSC domain-containing protein [Nocardioides sp.]